MSYADAAELQTLLRLDSPTATQTAAMERCLEAAATEIDWELGYTAARRPRIRRRRSSSKSTSNGPSNTGGKPVAVRRHRHRRRIRADRHRSQQLVPAPPEARAAQSPRRSRVTLAETMEAIAEALEPLNAEIDGLQVYPYLN